HHVGNDEEASHQRNRLLELVRMKQRAFAAQLPHTPVGRHFGALFWCGIFGHVFSSAGRDRPCASRRKKQAVCLELAVFSTKYQRVMRGNHYKITSRWY